METSATAGIVIVGNEILSAKVVDENSPYLCRQLALLGVQTRRIITVPDDFEAIGREVRACAEAFDWVFTSGGIGPTHDDVTIPAIAAAFGVEAPQHPQLAQRIREHYGPRLTPDHLRMAQAPAGAQVLETPQLRFPQLRFHNIFILPGVPELLRHKFDAIKHLFQGRPVILQQLYLRADEGAIAQALRQTEAEHPGVLIGSYPSFRRTEYSVRITVESVEAHQVSQASQRLQQRLLELSIEIVSIAE